MNWYLEVEPSQSISQGDLFFDCPIFTVDPDSIDLSNIQAVTDLENKIETCNIIVMNQACDLEFDPVDQIIAVGFQDISTCSFKGEEKTKDLNERRKLRWDHIKKIYNGIRPNYHLIGCHTGAINLNYQIVDFSSVFTIPYKILMDFRQVHGLRLRLNTPHRELLSQRFGSFFARIGLPNEDHIKEIDLHKVVKSFGE